METIARVTVALAVLTGTTAAADKPDPRIDMIGLRFNERRAMTTPDAIITSGVHLTPPRRGLDIGPVFERR